MFQDHIFGDGMEQGKNRRDRKKQCLIYFTALWCDSCFYAYPIYLNLASKYSIPKLAFFEVEITNPRMAGAISKYRLNTGGSYQQLPTLIMFEDGEEVLRFPPIDPKTGTQGQIQHFKEKELAKFFDLEK
eukprot:CAMPEP_0170560674 /NCGR_PEP_ID=MMETSP0211-20121228/50327_1 /TAXON_ID=311385 /ORGANISM="Pseudokeronopsis sp., Strain OXSARD2" /LENGTH=129 /DNA_ID=CAMNT_0010875179 /DNA_START=334 /DNA_END=720 /DNA_ORIENTATION=-